MVSSTRLALASVFLMLSIVASIPAQTTPEKSANGSVTGKVTLKNKGIAGVMVFAREPNHLPWSDVPRYRAITDQTGSYRITNIPAGKYTIMPVAPSLAFEKELSGDPIVVGAGETTEDINFAMVPGGVITGKVTDGDGKPVIEASVSLQPLDMTNFSMSDTDSIRTDDRGIYRAFGLRQGKYKVYVPQSGSLPGDDALPSYAETYYPSVTDKAKATVIEVAEGSETKNIDIVLGRALPTFTISGLILDAETGKPLANIRYGVYRSYGNYSGSSAVDEKLTDVKGTFRFENVVPGTYSVFVYPEDSGVRADSVSFEVVDHDINDLVIKAGRAASLSGVVVFEGPEEIKPKSLIISAWVQNSDELFAANRPRVVNPDGSFRISGLRKGFAHFSLISKEPNDTRQLALQHVERDGVVQPSGVFLNDGEHVDGLRLVVKYLTGAIHGQIKIEGDEVLPNSRISVWINSTDAARSGPAYFTSGSSPQLDSHKRFVIESLAAGTYQVNVAVFESDRMDTSRIYKEQVTVTDNTVSEVTITIKRP